MMARWHRFVLPLFTVLILLSGASCSIRGRSSAHRTVAAINIPFKSKPGRLSGVLVLHDDCKPGFYEIKLQGMLDRSTVQVEAQSDESGHFGISAPNGKYMMSVTAEGCGVKLPVELEDNTDHMILVDVVGTTEFEKSNYEKGGRLPASVLIEPNPR